LAEPFIGEIRLFSFDFAPQGWAQCNGQLLSIAQNQALYSLLGTTFGGDGVRTFALPDLQGRVPIAPSGAIPYGSMDGEETHVLTVGEMPPHTHEVTAGAEATTNVAAGNVWATTPGSLKAHHPTANAKMDPAALSASGNSQPHANMQPYTVVQYCIALQGYWPPKS